MASLISTFQLGLNQLKERKGLLFLLLFAFYFVWLLIFRIELTWADGQIVHSSGSIMFSGELGNYMVAYSIVYLVFFISVVSLSASLLSDYFYSDTTQVLLTRPIGRLLILFYVVLSTSILIWSIYALFNSTLFLMYGVVYGEWLSGLLTVLFPIFIMCLGVTVIVTVLLFLSKSAFSAFIYALILLLVIPALLEIQPNFQFMESVFVIRLFDMILAGFPDLVSILGETTDQIFEPQEVGTGLFKIVSYCLFYFTAGYLIFRKKGF